MTFASGFNASYAIAIDGAGNANLFSIPTGTGSTGILTFVNNLTETVTPAATGTAVTYSFSLSSTSFGLTAANGNAFPFRRHPRQRR